MGAIRPDAPPLSDAEFRMFRDLLRSHCGLHFDEGSRFLLEQRLGGRLRELELESFVAYRYLLRGAHGERELARVVDELTVNETWFFRERSQLRALVEEILPERIARRSDTSRPVHVWSAGCASGEEAFSVLVLALEAGLRPGIDLRIFASDISRRMLQRARAGVYRAASLRECEPALRRRYFTERDDGFRIADELKRHVKFTHTNLLDPARLSLLPRMDVVLCRNVIIYFDAETRRRVVASFARRLAAGGTLLLGHAESLASLSTEFELCPLRSDLVYRLPERPVLRDRFQSAALASLRAEGGAR